jgi:hypothetical protein
MERKPPVEVRRILRREVGFGCPVNGCGNPYLYWHHFDPPWREEEHHNPEGMIALCGEHHAKADVGAFTTEQLREFKMRASENVPLIRGRLDWMRNRLLAVVGGNFYYETPVIFQYRDSPIIWFTRDDDGYLLLNLRMLSQSREERLSLEENFWIARGQPDDLECPPSGRLLHAKYANGDEVRIEFYEVSSLEEARRRFPTGGAEGWGIAFPITAVEVHNVIGGTGFKFGPRYTTLPGVMMTDSFSAYCGCGIQLS